MVSLACKRLFSDVYPIQSIIPCALMVHNYAFGKTTLIELAVQEILPFTSCLKRMNLSIKSLLSIILTGYIRKNKCNRKDLNYRYSLLSSVIIDYTFVKRTNLFFGIMCSNNFLMLKWIMTVWTRFYFDNIK